MRPPTPHELQVFTGACLVSALLLCLWAIYGERIRRWYDRRQEAKVLAEWSKRQGKRKAA